VEIATREWAFLPDEGDQPQLSFDPATLDPNQPLPRSPHNLDHGIGQGSLKQKAKLISRHSDPENHRAEDRPATPEEKAALVSYTGWGAMPNAFAPRAAARLAKCCGRTEDLLSAEEYASARASTPNAHYTSTEVIQAIGQTMERSGQPGRTFSNRRLRRSLLWSDAEGLHPGTRRTGVELDSITGRIAANSTRIRASTRKHSKTRRFQDFFDAAIGTSRLGTIRSTIRRTAEVRT